MELPWLKLALFENKRSQNNSLRTNENVLQITGVEVEHDSGEIAFSTALATILKAGIRCIIYTSPSYVPGAKERWRILVPLSLNREPEVREKFVARVNGLFGGKVAPESFVLSQAYPNLRRRLVCCPDSHRPHRNQPDQHRHLCETHCSCVQSGIDHASRDQPGRHSETACRW
jgi:hypothetical protein